MTESSDWKMELDLLSTMKYKIEIQALAASSANFKFLATYITDKIKALSRGFTDTVSEISKSEEQADSENEIFDDAFEYSEDYSGADDNSGESFLDVEGYLENFETELELLERSV